MATNWLIAAGTGRVVGQEGLAWRSSMQRRYCWSWIYGSSKEWDDGCGVSGGDKGWG